MDVVVVGSVAVLARRGRSRSTKETWATLTTVEKNCFWKIYSATKSKRTEALKIIS